MTTPSTLTTVVRVPRILSFYHNCYQSLFFLVLHLKCPSSQYFITQAHTLTRTHSLRYYVCTVPQLQSLTNAFFVMKPEMASHNCMSAPHTEASNGVRFECAVCASVRNLYARPCVFVCSTVCVFVL